MTSVHATDPARVQTACRFCRYSKLKCSGTEPCDRCRKRSQECIYDARPGHEAGVGRPPKRFRFDPGQGSSRLAATRTPARAVAARPVTALQTTQSRLENEPTSHRAEDATPRFLSNRSDKRKRWLYLGASSTWAFNLRVAALIRQYLHDDPDARYEGFALDGDVYQLSLRSPTVDGSLDLTRLPSHDYAIYLVSTVQFHLGGTLRLFDEDQFLATLNDFYSHDRERVQPNKLWYTQLLLVLALGKGFLHSSNSREQTPSSELFLRAMSCLPDTNTLHDDPVLAMEVLATIALYFYLLDMKDNAYSYVSHSLRSNAQADQCYTDRPSYAPSPRRRHAH